MRGAVILLVVGGCSSFGATDDRAGAADAAVEASTATSYCAAQTKPPNVCDEFTGTLLSPQWSESTTGAATMTLAGERLRIVIPNGGGCASGDSGELRTKASFGRGKVTMAAKLSIDGPEGVSLTTANGGTTIHAFGDGGMCSVYVGWAGGRPSLGVDIAETGKAPRYAARTVPLLAGPVTKGTWLEVTTSIAVSNGGAHVEWSAGTQKGAFDVPECVWDDEASAAVFASCALDPFQIAIDDVAIWHEP